jgi:WD40 repeat protein/tRNA A-37 threonylcarbamoyl transferase component Bud32
MRDRTCPDGSELRGYLLGEVPQSVEQQILEHLAVCPVCEALATQLDMATDPLIDSLRDLSTVGSPNGTGTISLRDGARTSSPGSTSGSARLPSPPGYVVLDKLGCGGTSIVYKARQFSPNRFVALKMILTGPQANPDCQARFLAEADATAKLQHPHIVQIYAAGFHDGLPFLALEFMGGGSLAQRLGGTPQPAQESAALVEVLARAAHHAHRQGIVHRDLKPANVLFTQDGLPKIADFGLAKHERPDLTATGAVLGTPSYMAPEQATGDNPSVGPAADVYALGAILYELLTGHPPFRGATVLETLDQVRTQEPVPLRRLQPRTPHDLNIVCLKCLQKEPHRRYAGAEELAEDLRRFRAGEEIHARATGALEKTWRWSRRNPALALLSAALVLVVLVGTGTALGFAGWALREADDARVERNRANESADDARVRAAETLRQKEETRYQLYLARIQVARLALEEGDLTRVRETLASLVPRPGERDHRHFEWYYLDSQLRAELRRFQGKGWGRALAFSNDGKLLAAGFTTGVRVWEVESRREVFRADVDNVWCVAFSSDGTRLAYGSGSETRFPAVAPGTPPGTLYVPGNARGAVAVYDLKNARPAWSAQEPLAVLGLAFSPDGRTLAGATGWTPTNALYLDRWTGCVKGWHVATGEPAFQEDEVATLVGYAADGRLITAANGPLVGTRSSIRDDGKSRPLFPDAPYREVLSIEPRGDRVTVLGDSNNVITYDLTAGKPVGHAIPAQRADVARCGRRFCALYAPGSRSRKLDVRSSDGGTWHYSIVPHENPLAATVWSPDGRFLATADSSGEVKVWDAERGAGRVRFYQNDLHLSQLGFGPGSNRLATAAYGVVATKETGVWRWLGPTGRGNEFTSDGRALATHADGRPGLWEAGADRQILSLPLQSGLTVSRVVLCADGKRLLCAASEGHDGIIGAWDLPDKERFVRRFPNANVSLTAFSADGRTAAWLAGKQVTVWDLEDNREVAVLNGFPDNVIRLALSPDGGLVACGMRGYAEGGVNLRVHDLRAAGKVLFDFKGHGVYVWGLAFSRDGRRLVSSSRDGTVRVWETTAGQEVLALRAPMGMLDVALSPDNRCLAYVIANSIIDVFDTTPDAYPFPALTVGSK